MKEDPPLDFKCRDKFLVQSVTITADQEVNPVAQIVSIPLYGFESDILFFHISLADIKKLITCIPKVG